jgi:4-alpha-glucanotransferase
MTFNTDFFNRRRAGILLHPTSLPGTPGNGDLGKQAYSFVDFIADSAFSVWQMLPLGPPDEDLSPYQSQSVHAGNSLLISLDRLVEQGWLSEDSRPIHTHQLESELNRLTAQGWLKEDPLINELQQRLGQNGWHDLCLSPKRDPAVRYRQARLREARAGFEKQASEVDRNAYAEFVQNHTYWLEDYALFKALQAEHHHTLRTQCLQVANESQTHELEGRFQAIIKKAGWWGWAPALRDRNPAELKKAWQRLQETIEQHCFEQFVFFSQWQALKGYANDKGIYLFGDMPIFVAQDSADVWVNQDKFLLDGEGQPKVVAGVPPDYFSETGQRWGNPLYDWNAMQADGFRWWITRLKSASLSFDVMRIDHFRGFEAYWSIPVTCKTAIEGEWIKAPGHALFETLQQTGIKLPLVAEDLGIITPEVDALRKRFGLPGMRVLQFAFSRDPNNPHLPNNYGEDSLVYTGTHDNNTTLGWFNELPDWDKQEVYNVLQTGEGMPWALINTAYHSRARLAVIPMQDVLALDGNHRMNVPGVRSGNWRWRFDWSQVPGDVKERLRNLTRDSGRA